MLVFSANSAGGGISNQAAAVAFFTHCLVATEVLRKKLKFNVDPTIFLTSLSHSPGKFGGRRAAVMFPLMFLGPFLAT